MLSPFLKKLIFVRKFFILDGKIEILGERQILLPFSAIANLNESKMFETIHKEVKLAMERYAKQMGTGSGGMIKSVQDIYETMGLGKMRIIKLNADKKHTVLRLENITKPNEELLGGVLSGLFSFLFQKSLTKDNISIIKKGSYVDVSIK